MLYIMMHDKIRHIVCVYKTIYIHIYSLTVIVTKLYPMTLSVFLNIKIMLKLKILEFSYFIVYYVADKYV